MNFIRLQALRTIAPWRLMHLTHLTRASTLNKFDNLIIMGDFNIDVTKEDCSGFNKLEEL